MTIQIPSVRKFALLILAPLILALLAGCQPKGPKIEITPAEQDLGKMPQSRWMQPIPSITPAISR